MDIITELRNKLDAARARRIERIEKNDASIKRLETAEGDYPRLKELTRRQHQQDVLAGDAKRSVRERLRELRSEMSAIRDARQATGTALRETEMEIADLENRLDGAVKERGRRRGLEHMNDSTVPKLLTFIESLHEDQANAAEHGLHSGIPALQFPERADLTSAWDKSQDRAARVGQLPLLVKGWSEFFGLSVSAAPGAEAEERNGLAETLMARADDRRKERLLPNSGTLADVYPDLGVRPRHLLDQ